MHKYPKIKNRHYKHSSVQYARDFYENMINEIFYITINYIAF